MFFFWAMTLSGFAVSIASVPMRYTGSQNVWWAGGQYWDRRREAKLREIAKGPKKYDFVFLGGTLVQNWEGWCEKPDVVKSARLYSEGKLSYPNGPGKAVWDEMRRKYRLLNIGMAGDSTQHALWRLQNGELEGYVAKGVVLMPDWSNISPPEDAAEAVKGMLERIAEYQPQAITLLMALLPVGATRDDPERLKVARVNSLIKEFADGRKVVWCDMTEKFVHENGEVRRDLMPDAHYPLGKGYGVWRDEVLPWFRKICEK